MPACLPRASRLSMKMRQIALRGTREISIENPLSTLWQIKSEIMGTEPEPMGCLISPAIRASCALLHKDPWARSAPLVGSISSQSRQSSCRVHTAHIKL